ncbi:MAG: FAD:protein FMN transferase [Candidatus Aminicenantes bacterium]|nr:FAD:protein FMN transferase [Candidatus Aminicenantes bacterium]
MPQQGLLSQRFSHFSMGTTFEIILAESNPEYALQVSQAVFSEIDHLEALFNRFDPCSEISMINRLQFGQSLSISVDVYDCLKTAFFVQGQTHGAFDINYAVSSQIHSEWKKKSVVLRKSKNEFLVEYAKNPLEHTKSGMELDLGGIGKGFALDKALDILHDWSIDNALLHGGTSTAVAIGDAPEINQGEKGWPLGVGGNWPILKEFRFFLNFRALSGSGTEVKGEHIINPKTGRKASGHLGAWVSHSSAAVADALSTAFLVMDPPEVKAYCEMFPETWALVLIDQNHFDVYNKVLEK